MRLGVAGPVTLGPFEPFLQERVPPGIAGLGGSNVVELCLALLRRGHQISVYTLDRSVTQPLILRGEQLTIFIGPYRPRNRMRDLMKLERSAVAGFARQDRPDAVIAHWTYEFALGVLETDLPRAIVIHDNPLRVLRYEPSLYRVGRLVMHLSSILKRADFFAVSPYIADLDLNQLAGYVNVLPNFLRDSCFQYPKRKRLNEDRVLVSVLSCNSRIKNAETLVEAFSFIRKEMATARLDLVGADFSEGGRAHLALKKSCDLTSVRFLGRQDHMTTLGLIREADVMIHPSREESFGMTILEAMAVGTPVIAGLKSGGPPWLLDYGRAGVLTDVEDPSALACATLDLLRDHDAWSHLSELAWRRAKDCFSESAVVARVEEAMATCINRFSAGKPC